VVRDNGCLVPPGDAAALAQALAGVLDDPAAARRMGERGRWWVQQQFSVPAMVAGNLAVYRRLLGGAAAVARPGLAAAD
jgi:glycosyltransferase involved in cell wall biosynthesis